jgi:hypothetical protein
LNLTRLRSCLETSITKATQFLPRWVVIEVEERGWKSFGWQWLKRRLAEALAECFSAVCGSSSKIYLVDLHGGEHVVEEMGNKDIDIVLDCKGVEPKRLEQVAEEVIASKLRKLFGRDPYKLLGVPNIVEVHGASSFLGGRVLSSIYVKPLKLTS